MPKKGVRVEGSGKADKSPFSFRVRLGEHEVEIRGDRQEVLETIEKLPELMKNFSEAFKNMQVKASIVSVTAPKETEKAKVRGIPLPYPQISKGESCSKAILKLLESDWGRWRPRTLRELSEALEANDIHYPISTLSGVLNRLVKKGQVKRWKTEEGYVYIIAEKEEE